MISIFPVKSKLHMLWLCITKKKVWVNRVGNDDADEHDADVLKCHIRSKYCCAIRCFECIPTRFIASNYRHGRSYVYKSLFSVNFITKNFSWVKKIPRNSWHMLGIVSSTQKWSRLLCHSASDCLLHWLYSKVWNIHIVCIYSTFKSIYRKLRCSNNSSSNIKLTFLILMLKNHLRCVKSWFTAFLVLFCMKKMPTSQDTNCINLMWMLGNCVYDVIRSH